MLGFIQYKDYLLQRVVSLQEVADCVQGDPAGLFRGIAVTAATDRREGDRGEMMLDCQLQAVQVTGGEKPWRVIAVELVDRPHGMYHVAAGEPVASGDPC